MAGWEQVLTDLVNTRGAALKRYAYLLCGNDSDAEDLVQDALVRAFTRPRRDEIDNPEQYVRKAVLNLYLDRVRRRDVWRRVMPFAVAPDRTEDDSPSVDARHDLRAALLALTPRQRACVVLYYHVDLPIPEIAAHLGCAAGSVKRYLHDGRRRLAGLLDDDTREDDCAVR
ncbi:sigma-70 family RNA polymerase sigma factor [Micromonospora lupini]|uniref:Putative RNA polymerase sigma factor n=1 Tax=Micromonospora lupini str. Lupac 08 TaxID=1150864 RepID=I0L6J8_9ACTN|nr:sigma-70 family RNA polymerase sigma factor [Micromonospora lupini]CCH19445.1 Putative RNA polymerase sigma factor [Micromonospora lupini str. Lupac 08]